jgi:ATP-dependent exoDNAse (exonuclease V) alpha subunit
MQVRLDSGRLAALDSSTARHIDYGYAVTSYSSQGLTARRVLIHADTTQSKQLVNERYAYVAVSRGSHDAHVYTDNAQRLSRVLGREHSKTAAVDEFSRHIEQQQAVPAHAGRGRSV